MKKILFLVESLSGGGAEKVLLTMLKHLDYSKFNVTLFSIVNTGKYTKLIPKSVHYSFLLDCPKNLSIYKRTLYKIKYHFIYNFLPLKWVYYFFIPHHQDIEVAFVEGFSTKLLSFSSNKISKKITWLHSNPIKHHWTKFLYKDLKQEEDVYNKYNYIVTVAHSVETAFLEKFTHVNIPVTTLYNPIDTTEILSKSKKKNDIIPHTHRLRMVSVGRLTSAKAYDRLLRIVKKMHDEGYDFELWLLGDGEERCKLESYILNNNLTKIVTLWGFKENPYAFLKQCDLFVCSSISEGYSTAVTESLILGIPVITTDCSGMKELLGDNQYGIITENSEEALYDGLKNIIDTPSLLEKYTEQAVVRGNTFTLPSLMASIENFLLQ